MIVDCHCHVGKGDGLTGPWDTTAPLDAYLRRADAAGITHTVLFSVFTSDYERANREVARIVAARPERFSGFAFLHATRDRGRVSAIVSEAVALGLSGIKVHRHDAPITREICEAARRHALPVLYDVAGETHSIDLFAPEYRDVAFIIPHLGSFSDDWRAHQGLIDQLVRHPNVFADTSGVRRFDYLEEAVRRAGARKILFGSDGPWLHPAVELAKIHALGLSPRDRQLVLSVNLLRLLPERMTTPSAWQSARFLNGARPGRSVASRRVLEGAGG